ncbi:MAG: glycosyltransferase family 2 protein, partial [Oceanococcaceae bacterium]
AGWSVIFPAGARALDVQLEGAAGECVLLLEQSPAAAQRSLVLRALLARLPQAWQSRLRAWRLAWLRKTSQPLPAVAAPRWEAADLQGMRRHWQSSSHRPSLRLWVDGRGAEVQALQSSLQSWREQNIPALQLGLIAPPQAEWPADVLRANTWMSALSQPGADWQGILSAGSRLEPGAAYWLWNLLDPAFEMALGDERFEGSWPVQQGQALYGRHDPDYLRERGRLPGLCLLRQDKVAALDGGFADWAEALLDLALRTPASAVQRIDEPLICHATQDPPPDAGAEPAWLEQLQGSWERLPRDEGGFRWRPCLPEPAPMVSVVIPTRDRLDLLRVCVESLRQKTDYPGQIEIIVADNDSAEPATLAWLQQEQARGLRVVPCPGAFNFSRIVNRGVAASQGDLVLLLNNDIEITQADWLREMVVHALRPEVGCVGAKLYYPDGRIQHAGVTIGLGNLAGHPMRFYPGEDPGYLYRLLCTQRYRAVTAACLLLRRELFDAVGGLDAEHLAVAFNDVDFCLRVEGLGLHNLWTPHARLIHHESVSRGVDDTPEKALRYAAESAYLQQTWGTAMQPDPYYHRLLTHEDESCALAVAPWRRRPWLLALARAESAA